MIAGVLSSPMKQLRVNWRRIRVLRQQSGAGEQQAVTDLDSERGLADTTIAKDGYAPLIHDVWGVCWGEWEKTDEERG